MISQTLTILLWMLALSDGTRIWLDVPFVAQTRNGCGAACVSMVVRYWAHQRTTSATSGADPGTVLSNLYSTTGGGMLASQMKEYFENQGFRTYVFAAEWSDLNHHLARGRPVIVCLKEDTLHYVVVVGIDPHNDIVLVNDPARRKLTQIDRPSFEKSWNTCKNWTLLALPPSRE